MVSIIVLSYNTQALITKCLASVFKHTKHLSCEVIVVDNASHDQSVHMIKTRFPKVKMIESSENLGFGKGINLGASYAKGDMLLFLNSDTELFDDSLLKMIDFLREKKEHRVAVVGGKLRNKGKSTSSSHNTFYTLPKVFSLLFRDKDNTKQYHKPTRVDWVSGGFMLVVKESFERVKGFDKGYFMYIEDMDLCFRLAKKNYRTYYFPEAQVKHIGQGSSNRTFAIIQIYKGLLYFYKKHKTPWQYFVLKGMLLTKATGSYLIGIMTKNTYLKNTYLSALQQTLS